MTRDEVEAAIARAFADAPMPRMEAALAPPSIEARYVVEHFLGRTRADVGETFLPSLQMEDFTYMTDAAVAYYLPPVLTRMLRDPHDFELWTYLRGFLASARESYATSLHALSRPQLEAIAAWADFLVAAFDGAFGCDPKAAAKVARLYRELADARA